MGSGVLSLCRGRTVTSNPHLGLSCELGVSRVACHSRPASRPYFVMTCHSEKEDRLADYVP